VSRFSEDELLPLSALQHLIFCERQCALIHIEGQWADNALTVEGTHLHRRADAGPDESRPGIRIARAVQIRSLRMGLSGTADVVEFHASPDGHGAWREDAVGLPRGSWQPFPVEYKRGRPKRDLSDRIQLCAQALCLEEMLGASVPSGALYYGRTRRRLDVAFDQSLRAETERAASRLHDLIRGGTTPRVRREPKCDRCSLIQICLPGATAPRKSASRYLVRALAP
jgi:CRISPR-associated exonuclease Cas4